MCSIFTGVTTYRNRAERNKTDGTDRNGPTKIPKQTSMGTETDRNGLQWVPEQTSAHTEETDLTITCSCCPYLYFGSAIMLVTYFVNFR